MTGMNIIEYIHEKGNLHDCRISSLKYFKRTLHISIKDININEEGLESYKGREPVELIFRNIEDLHLNYFTENPNDLGWILDCQARVVSGNVLDIIFEICGKNDLRFRFSGFDVQSELQ